MLEPDLMVCRIYRIRAMGPIIQLREGERHRAVPVEGNSTRNGGMVGIRGQHL